MGYNYYWNRDKMWNDWVWGYPYANWRWNKWNQWNKPYGWNNYYGWNNGVGITITQKKVIT